MTPDLLTLSRAVAALPGAPTPGGGMVLGETDDDDGGYRDESGIRWVWDDDRGDFRLFDLADNATGGVMLAAIDADVTVMRTVDGQWQACLVSAFYGSTLAAACARVMVARGRWA